MNTTTKKTAYIFRDVGGWYICDDASTMLDTRGRSYRNKREAVASLRELVRYGQTEYTHYRTGPTTAKKI